MSPEQFQLKLLHWFDNNGRKNLPWQNPRTPYRVWLSEIMLQQTQVGSVIPYFNRFVAQFPDFGSLATADLDEILHFWSGLGYYARARNLHKTAKLIANQDNEFPHSIQELTKLPGIGRSTAGAILSMAYGQSQPILDGNVKRVLTRYKAITGWPGHKSVTELLWEISRCHTPQYRVADYTQAIMDLGATVCTRSKPKCKLCPLNSDCLALQQGVVDQLPEPKPRKILPVKRCFFLLLEDELGRILLEKRALTGIWGGLWSLPEFPDIQSLHSWGQTRNFTMTALKNLPVQRHSFSHFHLEYIPISAKLIAGNDNKVMETNSWLWYKAATHSALGFPAPIARLLNKLENDQWQEWLNV
jgi:A/G-specific adenine glycosylase